MCLPVEQVQVYWNFYTDEYRAESKFGTRKELFVLNLYFKVQSNLSERIPLYYGQFLMSRQNSHIFSLKKTSIIRTLSNTDYGHQISAQEE